MLDLDKKVAAAVAVMSVSVPRHAVPEYARPAKEEDDEELVPPAWMHPLTALQTNNDHRPW